MPYVEHLVPLTGYESSSVADINDGGVCVGRSFDPTQPSWLPGSHATLWSGQTATYLRKVPAPSSDPSLFQSSEAMRIDKSGRVLCRIDLSGDESAYYLWLSETEAAIDLGEAIDDLKDAIDLNDDGRLLLTLKGGGLAVQDMNGGALTFLPPYPFTNDSEFHPAVPIGLDNAGRVVVYWWSKTAFATMPPAVLVRYWLPSSPDQWHELPDTSFWFPPVLAKVGHVLLTESSHSSNNGRACYYDLDTSPPSKLHIPRGENVAGRLSFYLDARSDDWFVGGEGEAGTYTPTLYKKLDNTVALLEYAYPDPDWHPSYAVGISSHRMVGEGSTGPGGRPRAWRMILNAPYPPPGPFSNRGKLPTDLGIDPLASLLGATSRWYILLTLPDPAPFDVLRQLVKSLKPEERRQVLVQVQEIDSRFKALAKMLRDTGLGH